MTASRPPGDLTGRTAVVTGSARGIGRAVVLRLARAGAHVVGLDRESATQTTELVQAEGGSASDIICDVGNPDQVAAAFKAVEGKHGGVDVLVNNAAIGSHTAPEELGVADLEHCLRINVIGYFVAARCAHNSMRRHGGGSIVNISSIAGSSALGRGNLAYSMSKGAINQMTRELAVEWAPDRVRVTAVAPSQVRTEGFSPLLTDPTLDHGSVGKRMLRGIPLGRLAEPEDIAAVVHFLAGDASGFITGAIIPVDGGNLALNAGGSIGSTLEETL